jgi:hypothetical protein
VDRYRQVDFILRGKELADTPGVILQQRDGDRYRALVDVTGPALESLKALGADQIAATPVTLEDMFIGLTQG